MYTVCVVWRYANLSEDTGMTHFEHYRLAKSYEQMGKYEDALSAYAKAIELRQDYAHAWFYKAQLHYRLKQYGDALQCAERTLQLEPSWADHVTKIIADCKSKVRSAI